MPNVSMAWSHRSTLDRSRPSSWHALPTGRVPSGFRRSSHITSQEQMIQLMVGWKDLGINTFILQIASPFDDETAERFATEIRPVVVIA